MSVLGLSGDAGRLGPLSWEVGPVDKIFTEDVEGPGSDPLDLSKVGCSGSYGQMAGGDRDPGGGPYRWPVPRDLWMT